MIVATSQGAAMAKKSLTKKDLTPNQRLFLAKYLIDRNATRAYKEAYPKCKTDKVAGVMSCRLLRNDRIQAELAKALEKQEKRLEISADKTVLETARLAFSDLRKFFKGDGSLIPIHELDDHAAAAISSVEVVVDKDGQTVHKIKLWDKNSALEKLGKHFKIFVERKEVTGPDGGPIKNVHSIHPSIEEKLKEIVNRGKSGA